MKQREDGSKKEREKSQRVENFYLNFFYENCDFIFVTCFFLKKFFFVFIDKIKNFLVKFFYYYYLTSSTTATTTKKKQNNLIILN